MTETQQDYTVPPTFKVGTRDARLLAPFVNGHYHLALPELVVYHKEGGEHKPIVDIYARRVYDKARLAILLKLKEVKDKPNIEALLLDLQPAGA